MNIFDPAPGANFPAFVPLITWFFVVMGIGILLMIVLRVASIEKAKRKFLQPMTMHFFWFALAGLVLILFRLNGIPYLSMEFLYVLWFIAFIYYLYSRFKVFAIEYPKYRRKISNYVKRDEDPYLPKPKKKKKKK